MELQSVDKISYNAGCVIADMARFKLLVEEARKKLGKITLRTREDERNRILDIWQWM